MCIKCILPDYLIPGEQGCMEVILNVVFLKLCVLLEHSKPTFYIKAKNSTVRLHMQFK